MVAGYILTGGKSRRMEGRAKLFLNYQGRSFYESIQFALDVFSAVYLSVAEENASLYASISLPQIVDIYSDAGPLGGICSGLKLCHGADALFVTACDTPLISREDVGEVMAVYQAYRKSGEEKIIVAESGGRVHPLFGIYPKAVLGVMEAMILEGDYKMRNLLNKTKAVSVLLSQSSQVGRNINTLEDYKVLKKDEKVLKEGDKVLRGEVLC